MYGQLLSTVQAISAVWVWSRTLNRRVGGGVRPNPLDPPAHLSLNTFEQKQKTHVFLQWRTSFWRAAVEFCDLGAATQLLRLKHGPR